MEPDPGAARDSFPVVGIGASAGGIKPLAELLSGVSRDAGMSFLVLVHLAPNHPSMLPEILQRDCEMEVVQAEDGMSIQPGNVYVVPPNAILAVANRVLRVLPREPHPARHMPIDYLFSTLAEDQKSSAIGVILSGSGSDGALGAKAIKAEGGITLAQDATAEFGEMPRSADGLGAIDYVLPIASIVAELLRLGKHSYTHGQDTFEAKSVQTDFGPLFTMLESAFDLDFRHYKPSTVGRRIRRRMALQRLDDLSEYIHYVREQPGELQLLYQDILIRVTGFFRDEAVFDFLAKQVVPDILSKHEPDMPIRVWVPGCATGEEAYSLAICLLEATRDLRPSVQVQVFGTDVSEMSIERARAALYPENIAAEVSPERLRKFFTRVEGQYRISKQVRDVCVFARQNLTKDPPFSRLDLISCRNVMIYLGNVLQRKVMTVFQYALKPTGYLVLGNSETIGAYADLFQIVDRRHKIYQKNPAAGRLPLDLAPSGRAAVAPASNESSRLTGMEEVSPGSSLFREADRVVLNRLAPSGVLINDELEILQFRGKTSAFLEPAPGTASFNVLMMARTGLLAELRIAIHKARSTGGVVRHEGIPVQNNGQSLIANIEVIPFTLPTRDRYFVILFERAAKATGELDSSAKKGRSSRGDSVLFTKLEKELEATRGYLQSIIEEQEAMNEELRSANEEIQSSNEELQSTNEELETAKEELQSSNEELLTVNEEMEHRNAELAEANNDLSNLLASIDIPIVMLGSDLMIRRFNQSAQRVLHLIPNDMGRAIGDLKLTLSLDDLEAMILSVLELLEVKERDVQDRTGHWYSLRIRPYRTSENRIEGVVLALIDIDRLKAEPAAGKTESSP